MLETTSSSSSACDPEYYALSPAFRALIDARLVELEGYRAAAAEPEPHSARLTAQAEYMRKVRTDAKTALVQRFITQSLPMLRELSERDRCGFLRKRMEAAQCRGEAFTIPDDRFIRKCLKNTDILGNNDATDESERSSV